MKPFTLAKEFVMRDMYQRIDAVIEDILTSGAMLDKLPPWEDWPRFGTVQKVEELPRLAYAGVGNVLGPSGRGHTSLHYVDGDRVLYFPYAHEGDALDVFSPLFSTGRQTYHPSATLVRALWMRMPQYERPFPQQVGKHIVYWDDKSKMISSLQEAGFYIELAGYEKNTDEILGVERLKSKGFISRFAMPGDDFPRVINTVEKSGDLIQLCTQREEDHGGDKVTGNAKVNGPVAHLKGMCFQIQREHGSVAAKHAWQVYKQAAKYLSDNAVVDGDT